MKIQPIKTKLIKPPQDDLFEWLSKIDFDLNNCDIFVITSKIVSIHQGRCVPIKNGDRQEKNELAIKEADKYIKRKNDQGLARPVLTWKNNILITSSGIDESNGDGYYILWPDNLAEITKEIYLYLQERFELDKFGLIITDTKSNPFRLGATGFSLSHFGFAGLNSYQGEEDLFGREFKSVRVNVVDSLAVAAVLSMGEGNETTPIAKISSIPNINFAEIGDSVAVNLEDDNYADIFRQDLWEE